MLSANLFGIISKMERIETSRKQEANIISSFSFEEKTQPVSFVETTCVADGVKCDVYKFIGDSNKDLGIIRIEAGRKTPLQKVLKGDRTIEGFISGRGKLTVIRSNGEREIYEVGKEPDKPVEVLIGIGETMQWEADKDSKITAYEICFPPYEDGRYENLA